MSILKSLLQRLLETRTTPELAGHNAMPSSEEIKLTPSSTSKEVWGDVCTGTAPSDGYIRMSFTATSSESLGSARSFGAVVFSTPQMKGDIVSVICPVAKGTTFAMSVRNADNITCSFVKLIGSIVGGGRIFAWRSLLCLRTSYNYLPKVFSRAKGLGLQNSVPRLSTMALTSLAQAPLTSSAMLRRATVGQPLGAIQAQSQLLKFKSRMAKWRLPLSLTEILLGVASAVTLKKEPLLSSYAEVERLRIILFGSTKQVPTLNSLAGGALC